MSQKTVPYSTVDVFTASRFQGNPVAVIRDGTGLSDREMQSIATEFGFSETTFILPPNNADFTARVRIFTTLTEIPFAGHPNIGTAFVIATEETVAHPGDDDNLAFDELGGSVVVRLTRENEAIVGACITAPQRLAELGKCDPDLIAGCLGLSEDQISTARFEPCVATIGLPFAFVELVDLFAIQGIEMNVSKFNEAKAKGPSTVDGFAICACVVMAQTDNTITLRVRVLCPLGHPPEDPATGSAAGALAALLAPTERNDNYRVDIEQGVEMGRPSQIEVTVPIATGIPEISGRCVGVSTGVVYV